jgi:ketopantoate reductase
MAEQIKTITVDGVEHELATFPTDVQRLVGIHQHWEAKLIEARLQVPMIEAAIRDLTRELTGKIKQHLEETPAEDVIPEALEEGTEIEDGSVVSEE